MKEDKILTISSVEDANAAAAFVLQAIKGRYGCNANVIRLILDQAYGLQASERRISRIQFHQKDSQENQS